MTDTIKAELAALEAEHADLAAREFACATEHESLAAQIAPLEARQRANEAARDAIKPRLRELAEKIPPLRKAAGT